MVRPIKPNTICKELVPVRSIRKLAGDASKPLPSHSKFAANGEPIVERGSQVAKDLDKAVNEFKSMFGNLTERVPRGTSDGTVEDVKIVNGFREVHSNFNSPDKIAARAMDGTSADRQIMKIIEDKLHQGLSLTETEAKFYSQYRISSHKQEKFKRVIDARKTTARADHYGHHEIEETGRNLDITENSGATDKPVTTAEKVAQVLQNIEKKRHKTLAERISGLFQK